MDEAGEGASSLRQVVTSPPAEKKQRRQAEGTGTMHDPPCDCCERRGISCEKERGGGACVMCFRLKEKCNYSGKRQKDGKEKVVKVTVKMAKTKEPRRVVKKRCEDDISDDEDEESGSVPGPKGKVMRARAKVVKTKQQRHLVKEKQEGEVSDEEDEEERSEPALAPAPAGRPPRFRPPTLTLEDLATREEDERRELYSFIQK